jgi:hypothetical protein
VEDFFNGFRLILAYHKPSGFWIGVWIIAKGWDSTHPEALLWQLHCPYRDWFAFV